MSVQEMLKEMSSRAFNASYDAYMRNAYGLWAETDFKEEEYDYAKGVQDLDSVLTEEQHKKLKIMEENYRHNVEYASRYGFKAGLYSGFSQYFIGTEAAYDSFESTLMKNLMEMPGMIRHQSFYKRNEDNLTIANALKESLEERIYEHIVSIECAWGQRIHSAACHGFYCGYRAALNLIDDIKPLDSSRMIQHTLLLEYHLGYIGSYEEMERRNKKKSAEPMWQAITRGLPFFHSRASLSVLWYTSCCILCSQFQSELIRKGDRDVCADRYGMDHKSAWQPLAYAARRQPRR